MGSEGVTRLLVITLSNIGDLVMTTPVFEALNEAFPNCPIDCLADARSCELLSAAPYIGEIFIREKGAALAEKFGLIRCLRRRRYRLIVDLRTPVLPYLLRAERRLIKLRGNIPGAHAVEEHYSVIASILPTVEKPPPCYLYLDSKSTGRAERFLSALPGTQWLAVAPGANWAGKKWPSTQYQALLRSAASLFDGAIVVGSADDNADASKLTVVGMPVLNMVGRTDLPLAAALLMRAKVFIGNDSGLGHVAAAVGLPTMTIFGPGRPERYRPWGRKTEIVRAPMADLARLTSDEVFRRLKSFIRSASSA